MIINKGAYTVDGIRMIQTCGGTTTDILRGPDIMLDQAAVFVLTDKKGATPCSYQLRGFFKLGGSKTWGLSASEGSFKFGGDLVFPKGYQYDYNHECYFDDPM